MTSRAPMRRQGPKRMTPKPYTTTRLLLEQAIARGVPNHQLMADYDMDYATLRRFIDRMADESEVAA